MTENIDQNKLIDKYERLFAEEGWKELVSDFTDRQKQLEKQMLVDQSTDDKKLYRAQGQYAVFDYIISLESTVEAIKVAQQGDLPEVQSANE